MTDDAPGCPVCGSERFTGISEWTQPAYLLRLDDGDLLPEWDTVENCVGSQTDAQGRDILRCVSCEREYVIDGEDLVVPEASETVEVDREAIEVLLRFVEDAPALDHEPEDVDVGAAVETVAMATQPD